MRKNTLPCSSKRPWAMGRSRSLLFSASSSRPPSRRPPSRFGLTSFPFNTRLVARNGCGPIRRKEATPTVRFCFFTVSCLSALPFLSQRRKSPYETSSNRRTRTGTGCNVTGSFPRSATRSRPRQGPCPVKHPCHFRLKLYLFRPTLLAVPWTFSTVVLGSNMEPTGLARSAHGKLSTRLPRLKAMQK